MPFGFIRAPFGSPLLSLLNAEGCLLKRSSQLLVVVEFGWARRDSEDGAVVGRFWSSRGSFGSILSGDDEGIGGDDLRGGLEGRKEDGTGSMGEGRGGFGGWSWWWRLRLVKHWKHIQIN